MRNGRWVCESRPPCFEPHEWLEWLEARWEVYRSQRKPVNYCVDCTPEHQQRMIAQGRCNHPGLKFRRAGDGALIGLRQLEVY